MSNFQAKEKDCKAGCELAGNQEIILDFLVQNQASGLAVIHPSELPRIQLLLLLNVFPETPSSSTFSSSRYELSALLCALGTVQDLLDEGPAKGSVL